MKTIGLAEVEASSLQAELCDLSLCSEDFGLFSFLLEKYLFEVLAFLLVLKELWQHLKEKHQSHMQDQIWKYLKEY